jgi:hypothetical protein
MIRSGIGARIRGVDGRIWGTVYAATDLTWKVRGTVQHGPGYGPGPARKHENGSVWFWEEEWLDFIEAQQIEDEEKACIQPVDQAEVQKAVMKLQKKLREIEGLEKRRDAGENLASNQLTKIQGKSTVEEDLENLQCHPMVDAVNVSVTTPGGGQVLAPATHDVCMRIGTLAERSAEAMGCEKCLLISEVGILPTHGTLESCGVVDGTHLIAVAEEDDLLVVSKHFSRMLMRLMPKLPKRFSITTLVREGMLELCNDSGRLIGFNTCMRLRLGGGMGILPCAQPLPEEIGLLTKLRRMTLGVAGSLPREVRNLKFLEELVLEGGFLEELPREIGELQCLQTLRLAYLPSLKALPAEIDMLVNLRSIEVVGCQKLAWLPPRAATLAHYRDCVDSWGNEAPRTPPWD